ncbi:hypothetical protein BGZ83_003118, partial [Gryganskiella cystojenkinii]
MKITTLLALVAFALVLSDASPIKVSSPARFNSTEDGLAKRGACVGRNCCNTQYQVQWKETSRHREDGPGMIVSSGISCSAGNTCSISATQTRTITTTWSAKLSPPEVMNITSELGFSYSDNAVTTLGYQMSWKDDPKERYLCFSPEYTVIIDTSRATGSDPTTGPTTGPGTGPQCISEDDCPGDQVCTMGKCGPLGGGGSHSVTPGSCTSADDCDGDNVCNNGVCGPEGPTSGGGPTSGTCKTADDCSGDNVCNNGVCGPEGPTSGGGPPSGTCKTADDCSGDNVCNNGVCGPEGPTSGGGSSSGKCKSADDCSGDN